jgi:hypothetical protein
MDFVASSLMIMKSEDEVSMGVELLCLIGQGSKACRILQDLGNWEKAARIAKCILPLNEREEVLLRWANHLSMTESKMNAIGMYLSLGLFNDVLNLLNQSKLYDIATMFIKACETNGIEMKSKEDFDNETKFINLKSQIYFAYATHLEQLGNKSSTEYHNLLTKFSGNNSKSVKSTPEPSSMLDFDSIMMRPSVESSKQAVETEIDQDIETNQLNDENSKFSLF